MRIVVLGAGAVGCFFGARLALAGQAVTLVGRPRLAQAIGESGLTLSQPDTPAQAVPGVRAATSLAEALAAQGPFDLGLITVKAYDTAAIAEELAAAGAAFPVLTLQNGVGNEETLAERLGPERVVAGATDTPVSMATPGQVTVHKASYKLGLAPVGLQAPAGTAALALYGAGYAIRQVRDYRGLKWTKLLMNLLANASAAILDWTPRQVMADPVMATLEARAWQETLAAMAARGIRPVTLGGYPFPLLAPLARRLPAPLLARGLRSFVSGGRGSKMPSLHMALAAGARSEVAWLNGAVVRAAQTVGLAAPVNQALADILLALSEGRADREAYRGRVDRIAERVAACGGAS